MEKNLASLRNVLQEEILTRLVAFLIARDSIINKASIAEIHADFTRLFSTVGANTAKRIGLNTIDGESIVTECLDHIFSSAESIAAEMQENDSPIKSQDRTEQG